jgi:hypothetical protein
VVEAWTEQTAALPPRLPLDGVPGTPSPAATPLFTLPEIGPPISPEEAEELLCVAGWLDRHAATVEVVDDHRRFAWPLPPVPSFHPSPAPKTRVLHR